MVIRIILFIGILLLPETVLAWQNLNTSEYQLPDSIQKKISQFYTNNKKLEYLIGITEREQYRNPQLAIRVANEALIRAKACSNRKQEAQAYLWLAWLEFQHNQSGRLNIVVSLASISVDLNRQIGTPKDLAWSLCILAGAIRDTKRDTFSGRPYLTEARNLIAKINTQKDSLWLMGYWHLIEANHTPPNKLKHQLLSLALFEQTGDSSRVGRICINLVGTLIEQKDYERASVFALRSINALKKIGYELGVKAAIYKHQDVLLHSYTCLQKESIFEKIREFGRTNDSILLNNPEYLMRLGMSYNQRTLFLKSKDLQRRCADTAMIYLTRAWNNVRLINNLQTTTLIYENLKYTHSLVGDTSAIKQAGEQRYLEMLEESKKNFVEVQTQLSESYNADRQKTIEEESTRQKYIIGVFIAFIAIGSMAFYIFYQRRNTENLNRELNSRIEALRAQMNPHFISNALNAIDSLVNQTRNKEASHYIIQFSRLCRIILNNSRSENISLGEELDMLRYFMNLEQLRMDGRLQYRFDIDQALNKDQIALPPMILQPFVENAIWHGIVPKSGVGTVTIKARKKDDHLYECLIEDDGIGRKKSAELRAQMVMTRPSFGLAITEERIEKLHKLKGGQIITEDLYHDDGSAAGTRVVITLPIQNMPAS